MSTTIDESTTQTDGLARLRERRAGLLRELAELPVTDILESGEIRRERSPELERALAQADAEIAEVEAGGAEADDLERRHAESEEAGEETREAERAVVPYDEAAGVYDLTRVERELAHLDRDHPSTREAWATWERRRLSLLEGQPVHPVADIRRHVADLRRRRRDLQDSLLRDVDVDTGEIHYFHDPTVEIAIANIDREVAALESQLGIGSEPEEPKLDQLDVAAGAAFAELAGFEAKRAELALRSLEGQAGAAEELAELDERSRELRVTLEHVDLAKQERARVEAERAEAERAAELEHLTRQAAEVGRDRDRAFAEVVDAVENLVPVVQAALETELRAQAAARATGAESVPNHYRAPLLLVLAVLQHGGLDVNDIDVPGAQWRAKLIETWRRPGLRCSICNDPAKAARAAELAASGATHAVIATEVGASKSSIQRHLSAHVKEAEKR